MRSWIGAKRERRLAERHVPQPWFVKGITVRSRLMQPSDYGINSLIRYPTALQTSTARKVEWAPVSALAPGFRSLVS